MKTKIDRSTSEWDVMETENRTRLKELLKQAKYLDSQRAEMLLAMADGDEKATLKEIERIKNNRVELGVEIESIESLLTAIPNRRKLARAAEIEQECQLIQALEDKLEKLAPGIDRATENLVLSVREYYDVLSDLSTHSHWGRSFVTPDIGLLESIGFFLRKHDLWRWVKIGPFRSIDAKPMAESINNNQAKKLIVSYLLALRTSAGRLRGEKIEGPEHCSECFGVIKFDYSNGNKYCSVCGRTEGENIQNLQIVKQPVED